MFSYSNIGTMLDLNPASKIMFCGPDMDDWYNSFIKIFPYSIHEPVKKLHRFKKNSVYDLVIMNTVNFNKREFFSKLNEVSSLLDSNGHLITLGKKRYNARNIVKKYFLRKQINWKFLSGRRESTHIKYLKKNGFISNIGFFVLPNCQQYERLVSVDNNSSNDLNRFVRLQKYLLVDKYFFISNRNLVNGIDKIVRNFQKQIISKDENNKSFTLCGLEFRSRGALIIYLKNKKTNEEFVARSSHYQYSKTIIKKNADMINEMNDNENIPRTVKDKIPKQFGRVEYANSSFYIEEKKQGKLAWKAIQNSNIEETIFKNACDFAINIERATRKDVIMDQALFDEMYRSDFEDILSQDHIGQEVKNIYFQLIEKLENQMLGKKQIIVCSHGDYGYGNIFVNKTGEITGVIDWDAARQHRIQGYTLFNLMYTRQKILVNGKDKEVLDSIGKSCLSQGRVLILFNGDYEKEFQIDKTNIGIVIATFCIIWVLYGARYYSGYNENNTINFLKWALNNCYPKDQEV